MKLQLFFLFVCLNFPLFEGKSQNNCNPEVIFKTTLNGGYFLKEYDSDTLYYLVDCNIINNTDSTIRFLTHSCAISAYVVTDNKDVSVCIMNCSGNFRTRISLKPNQSISFPVILKAYHHVETKIGFVFLTHHEELDTPEYYDVLTESIKKLENILWSNPIELINGQGFPYKIVSGK